MEAETLPEQPTTEQATEQPSVEQTTESIPTLEEQEKSARRMQIIVLVAGVVFIVVLVAAIVLMALNPTATTVIRDIAIVFVAVETFLIGLAMLLLIFQIQTLIQVLRDEIQPLLRSVNDTASTVRGTTAFVSHNVVSPIIKAVGALSGARRVIDDLIHVVRGTRAKAKPTQSQPVQDQTGGNTNGQTGE